jgi:hypothetical protein
MSVKNVNSPYLLTLPRNLKLYSQSVMLMARSLFGSGGTENLFKISSRHLHIRRISSV